MGNGTHPNPYAPLGLPPSFAPIEPAWTIGKIDVRTELGARTVHVLILDGAHGRAGYAFSRETWGELARKMYEQLSGLSLASPDTLPPHPTGGA